MRFLITCSFLALFQLQAWASSATNCYFRNYKIELNLDQNFTSIMITERMSHEIIFEGVVTTVETSGLSTNLLFDSISGPQGIISLKTSDYEAPEGKKIFGFITGSFNRYRFNNESFACGVAVLP